MLLISEGRKDMYSLPLRSTCYANSRCRFICNKMVRTFSTITNANGWKLFLMFGQSLVSIIVWLFYT